MIYLNQIEAMKNKKILISLVIKQLNGNNEISAIKYSDNLIKAHFQYRIVFPADELKVEAEKK